jgi:hypothetical protein
VVVCCAGVRVMASCASMWMVAAGASVRMVRVCSCSETAGFGCEAFPVEFVDGSGESGSLAGQSSEEESWDERMHFGGYQISV